MLSDSPDERDARISVLVVIYQGNDAITLHENEDSAWQGLVTFVDDYARKNRPLRTLLEIADEKARVDRFFSSADDFYMIIKVDISELANALEALPQRRS